MVAIPRSINSEFPRLREQYANDGVPPDADVSPGTFAMEIKKGPDAAPTGPDGTPVTIKQIKGNGQLLLPFQERGGGNPGASFQASFDAHEPRMNERYVIPVGNFWNHMVVDWNVGATNDVGSQTLDNRALDTAGEWWFALSAMCWQDGTNRWTRTVSAPLPAGTGVATNKLALINADSSFRLKRGYHLAVIDAGLGFVSGVRAAKRDGAAIKISEVDEDTGILTFTNIDDSALASITAAVPTAADGDYLGLFTNYETAAELSRNVTRVIPQGVFTYCPITDTEADGTVFGVLGSVDKTKRRGKRLFLDQGTQPDDVVQALAQRLTRMPKNLGHGFTATLWQTNSQLGNLHASFANVSEIQIQPIDSPLTFQRGMTSVAYKFTTGHVVRVVTDPMLCDIELSREQDQTRVLTPQGNWSFPTDSRGINWQMRMGDGAFVRQVTGDQDIMSAPYGAFGQLIPILPANNTIMSSRAKD